MKKFLRRIVPRRKKNQPSAPNVPQQPLSQDTNLCTLSASLNVSRVPPGSQLLGDQDIQLPFTPVNIVPFPFLDLPGELRNEIYQYLVVAKGEHDGSLSPTRFVTWFAVSRPIIELSILRVNKQIHYEAAAVMYRKNRVVVGFNLSPVLKPRCFQAQGLLFAPQIDGRLDDCSYAEIFSRFKKLRLRLFFFRPVNDWYTQTYWESLAPVTRQVKDVCTMLAAREDLDEVSLEIDIFARGNVNHHPGGWNRCPKFSRYELWHVIAPLTLLRKVGKVEIHGAILADDARFIEDYMKW
ncbi:MAG: hypothetical protein M1836_004432 [Candelina mexicana]|nr:MAG: hypothetical protein M1836_004432 [Candelina mexicana]